MCDIGGAKHVGTAGTIDTETCRGSFSSNRVVRSIGHPQRRGGGAPPYGMATVLGSLATTSAGVDSFLAELADVFPEPHLDDLCARLETCGDDGPEVGLVMGDLFSQLRVLRERTLGKQWQQWIAAARCHPIRQLIHQDPFTHRAYTKPRGYAGDAELLDFIYGREEGWTPPPATQLGQHIFEYTTAAPASEGVRARRAFIATLIDRLCEEQRDLRVLSIAAGHLREALLSAAVRRKRFGRFVALDSDAASLERVAAEYGRLGVETMTANVRRLIAGRLKLEPFDLVYSTGLFDYVGPAAGRRLVSVMFRLLQSGGRLLVANFLPGIRDVGYMEAFMDWTLVYRTRQEMVDLTMEIPQHEIRDIRLMAEENQNIIFVEVRRR